ncbi:MAG: suppressor of fused domain protein [Lachnospiraceae bacterium]|nr:suppressor of fused domain protein [Lachnospiraceae bacterium]
MGENNENRKPKYVYTSDEKAGLLEFIEDAFGEIDAIAGERVSPDIELDLAIIKPTEDLPCYTVVTCGAGAYSMNVPKELEDCNLEHAEYVMFLPEEWNLENPNENNYWPIKLIKDCARMPIWTDSWMGPGHTLECDEGEESYAPGVEFNGAVLINLTDDDDEPAYVILDSTGRKVNFYIVIPLFPEELDLTRESGADILVMIFTKYELPYYVADPERPRLYDILDAAEEAGASDDEDYD